MDAVKRAVVRNVGMLCAVVQRGVVGRSTVEERIICPMPRDCMVMLRILLGMLNCLGSTCGMWVSQRN